MLGDLDNGEEVEAVLGDDMVTNDEFTVQVMAEVVSDAGMFRP